MSKKVLKNTENRPPLPKNYTDTFIAIGSFVRDLWDAFGTNTVTPLALYNRLIKRMEVGNTEGIRKTVEGFQTFFNSYEKLIVDNNISDIPRGTTIRYGDNEKVYLDIQNFIHKVKDDSESIGVIREHLLNICTILNPNEEKLVEVSKVTRRANNEVVSVANVANVANKEERFVSDIFEKVKTAASSIPEDANPMQTIASIMSSGVLGELLNGINDNSTAFDQGKMLSALQNMLPSITKN